MHAVRVAGGVDVGAGAVDGAVDGEGGGVDGLGSAAGDDAAGLVDEDEVGDADLREVRRQRVQPEVVRQDRVAHANVARDALVVAAVGEDAEGGRQVLFAVLALFLRGVAGVGADLEGAAGVGLAEGLDSGGWGAGGVRW